MNERGKLDLDPEEQEFLRECAGPPAPGADCPGPGLLLAAQAGVLPEEAAPGVASHLASCRYCQVLVRDLKDREMAKLTTEEERRIRARIFSSAKSETTPWWLPLGRPLPVAAMATLLVVAGVAIYFSRQSTPPRAGPVASKESAPTPVAAALRLDKPPVRLPLASVLIPRGQGGAQETYLRDLGAALDAYRKDDFAEAARRLEPLTTRYPRAVEAHFYLGVCRLFLQRNPQAVESFREAKGLAERPFARDIGWYLGLAYDRAGQPDLARVQLRALCEEPGEYQERACAALGELGR